VNPLLIEGGDVFQTLRSKMPREEFVVPLAGGEKLKELL